MTFRLGTPIRPAALLPALLPALLGTAAGLGIGPGSGLNLPGPSGVTEARLTPDEGIVACLGERLLVLTPSGSLLRAVPTGAPCAGLSVSADGRSALTRDDAAGTVTVWRLADGTATARLTAPQATGAGFAADGAVLIGSPRGLERVDPASAQRRTLDSAPVTALVTSPDGTHAVVGRASRVQLIATGDAAVRSGHACDDSCPVGTVGFSADSRSAAVQAGSQLVALRAGFPSTIVVREGRTLAGLPQRDGSVLTLEGDTRTGEVVRRDLLTGRRERTLIVPGGPLRPMQLSATGDMLGVGAAGLAVGPAGWATARRLPLPTLTAGGGTDPATGQPAALLPGGTLTLAGAPLTTPPVTALQTMNRATWLLVTGSGGLNLAQLDAGKVRTVTPAGNATHLSVNHWGNAAAIWNDDRLSVVAQKTGKVAATLSAPGQLGAARVTLSPDATRAFILPAQGEGFVALLANGKRFGLPTAPGRRATDVQISGKGVLAFTAPDGTTDLYQPGNRVPYATVRAAPPIRTLSPARFSPDSTLLAVPARDERGWRVDLVNTATGRVDARTPALADPPSFITWAADSRALTVGASRLDRLDSVTVFPLTD